MERNSCLQYKWLNNGVWLIWQSLRDSPNRQIKITVKYTSVWYYACVDSFHMKHEAHLFQQGIAAHICNKCAI